jgi:hypothetical protein
MLQLIDAGGIAELKSPFAPRKEVVSLSESRLSGITAWG